MINEFTAHAEFIGKIPIAVFKFTIEDLIYLKNTIPENNNLYPQIIWALKATSDLPDKWKRFNNSLGININE